MENSKADTPTPDALKRAPEWQLKPLGVPELEPTIDVTDAVITFGRDPSNTHVLPEHRYPHVSAHHARLVVREGQLIIEDLGSKNGTLVNGQSVDRSVLRNGDAIQLGEMGPRFAVVSAAGVSDTIATRPQRLETRSVRRRLSATTIMQVKKALGIPKEARVSDMLRARARRHNFKLIAIIAVLMAIGVYGANEWIDYELGKDAELSMLRRQLAEAQTDLEDQERSREDEMVALEKERKRLQVRIAQLEAAEQQSAGNLEQLEKQLADTKSRLERFNPVNLEERQLRDVARVARCVVLIERTSVFRNKDTRKLIFISKDDTPNVDGKGTSFRREGSGSGFCVTEEGWIISNAHVVKPPGAEVPLLFEGEAYLPETTLEVVFTGTARRYPATVQEVDEEDGNDVALLKIEPFEGMPTLGGLDLEVGEPEPGTEVFLFGFPLGTFALQSGEKVIASTFKGIMSRRVKQFLQVDAGVYPGNSGGPLTDGQGRIIGIVTAVQNTPQGPTAASIGYALPVARVGSVWPPPGADKD